MPTNITGRRALSDGRTKLLSLIATWLIIAAAVLIGSSLTGNAQAQAERGAIPSLTLESSQPGQLVITWETPEPAPTDYRVRWAPTGAKFLSYKDDNQAERGNLYPLSDVTTLTVNNLTPGGEYKVHMRSRYYDGEYKDSRWSGPWTEIGTQRVKDHPPAAPTGLTTSQVSHNTLTLSWDDPQDTSITGYRILRGTTADNLASIEANTDDASTEYQDDNVAPETSYHYAILALSQDGDGAQSPAVSITTIAEPIEEDPPATPTGLTTSQVSHNALTLSWDDPQDTRITGYRILRGPDARNLAAIQDDTDDASTEYTDATVEPETTYHYAILALSQDGDGTQSSAVSITTPAEPVQEETVEEEPVEEDLPATPTEVTTSNVAHNSLTLSWNDPQDDSITGYRVLRGNDAGSLSAIEANTGNANTEYTDTTVAAETTYHYAVLALSQDGAGNQSATFSVTTPAEPQPEPPPALDDAVDPPTGLSESNVKHDSLTLIWDDPDNDAITGYRILKGTEPDNLSVTKDNTESTNTKYTDSEVEKATTYFYSVNALTTNGAGPRSHLDVTTPEESIKIVPSQTEQASLQTVISSMDRTSHRMANLISRDMAQEFQTGTSPQGYNLASIDLYLTGISSDLTVELRTGSTTGALHTTLTPSGGVSSGHGAYTFVPPANTTLTADTHYWIVVKGNTDGWFKAALGEKVATVPGWKLADNYEFRPKYSYDEHGTKSVNTETKTFKVPGHMSVRINRRNNVATGSLFISGTPEVQQILTVSATDIQDDDGLPASFNYQWLRYSADGTTFEDNVGTDSVEYRLGLADEGKRIRARVNSFIDGETNDEGPFLSESYPSVNTVTAPLIYTMVSNVDKPVDPARAVTFTDVPRAQSFTTSNETGTYILSSATILSIDPEGDEFTAKLCEVQNDKPTESCTELDPPASFTAGPLEFTSPSDRTITLFKGASYALVFSAAAGTMVTLPATASDPEDPITLPGWFIRNKSQFIASNEWMERGHHVCYLIAIKGEPRQISQATGRPNIAGNPAVGQVMTASTDSIIVPEGAGSSFSYQWRRLASNGTTFEANVGTNSNQYRLTVDELDKRIQVKVNSLDAQGRVVGFAIESQAYPAGRTISAAPLVSNTSQTGNSIEPMSTEVAQSFTTGRSPHGHQLSRVTIFYDDKENRPVNLKVCETSSSGRPTEECWNLDRPGSFTAGPLDFTVPKAHFRVLDPSTTYAVVLNGPRPRTVETTIETACPQTDPDFTESCTQEVMVTVIVAAKIGLTTSDGEDTLSSPDWSIGNSHQENREDTWRNVSSGKSIRIALHAETAPNKEPTGVPTINGTARVGHTLTAAQGDIADQNGLPSTFEYQWKRYSAADVFEADISTNPSQYTLTASDLDRKIKVEVSYTDRHGYSEGPLTSEEFPHGAVLITNDEDDLLVSNIGNPETSAVQTTRKIAQVFATGTNPNGYELTSVTVSGNSAPVKICRFESVHNSSPSADCVNNPSPAEPRFLRREWLYAVVIDPNTVNVTDVNEEDQNSRPQWAIQGKYQEQNQQGNWHNTAQEHAVRMELHGKAASPFARLGQLQAEPDNQRVTLTWQSWLPNTMDVIQRIQYRVKQADQRWNPGWTNISGSSVTTETHTIRNLTNGIQHTIELRAVFDQDGQTVYSGSASISATPRAPLTAPRNLDASTEGDGGVRLSWSDPADSTLTGYQYRYHPGDRVWNPDWTNIPGSGAATTSHTLTGLAKNRRHTLEVRALRDDAQGPAASSSVTPRGPMPRLRDLTAAADDHEATLSWDNPGEHGITGYQHRRRATAESVWNPDWTSVPGSNANTTSHRVRPLVNLTAYTFEVRAMRGMETGRAASISATTPDGPATIPNEPTTLGIRQREQGFNLSWRSPTEPDERAPVTSYRLRHRQLGTASWQNVTVDDCCAKTVTGLTNRRHYEVEVAAVNRLGTSPWAGPVHVTPQPRHTEPPAPTGDAALSLGTLGPNWTTPDSGNDLDGSCTGTKSFRIIWSGPEDRARGADEWAAHINTSGGAGEVTYAFRPSPGERDYYELNGTVSFHGTGTVSLKLRGRFGQTWGTWSPTGSLYCHQTE